LIEADHRIGERAASEADSADRNRRLSDELVTDLAHAGLIGMLQPRRWGGLEVSFPDFVRVSQVLARYDVAASWVQVLLGCHHWLGALVGEHLQRELCGDNPHRLFVDVFAPMGELRHASDGLHLSGRWMFASGVHWSDFVALGANGPLTPGGEPEYLMLFVPKGDFRLIDDWDTVGLRGTGSCSVKVTDQHVVLNYETASRNLGRFLAGQEPEPGLY
jgi:3-hydroxy-9,10-secoandrosta-1,3,5(10)-triene-9,17-dione monooxygenase